MQPAYPVYIISKGRWKTPLTAHALEELRVPYRMVVEKEQFMDYASAINPANLLILPYEYLEKYDTFDGANDGRGKGPGAARNFCWEHSVSLGAKRHWVLDDNIAAFGRINNNLYVQVTSGTIFKCAEDFVDRYTNVALAGFNYDFFAKTKTVLPAFVLNTRIYSCLLIKNDIPYRWRGRYNEDTDLSLRVLKDGWCTIQFNAFIQEKATTQTVKGGNTAEFYEKEGTYNKSKMIEDMHPDVAKVVWKFNRWHHSVDYTPFKNNVLIKKEGLMIPDKINNYGMVMVQRNVRAKRRANSCKHSPLDK